MANDPLSRLASAIGLISHDDEHQRAAAVRGATAMLARHGLTWRDVGLIVSERLAGPNPRVHHPEPPRPQPEPPRPEPRQQSRSSDPFEDESAEDKAWSEWRRARGGGEAPKSRKRTRNPSEPVRHTGINVPGEIFGRIRVREKTRTGGGVIFDIDDETVVFGPLAAYGSAIGGTINRANGRRIHAKVVAPRERGAMPRVYSIDVMPG